MISNDMLRKIDFLQSLDDETITNVAPYFFEVSMSKDEILFEENDPGDCFYMVISGRVGLTKRLKVAEDVAGELTVFMPYDCFGELALIDGEPRSGTATILEDTILLKICKSNFLKICTDYPSVMFNIIRTMSKRLRTTNDKYIKMWDELIKQSKMAAIGSAASKIVHDIKTPLTIIILTSQIIERMYENSNQFSDKIIKQVKVVDSMVREILEFARGEKFDLDIRRVNLIQFFEDLDDDFDDIIAPTAVDYKIMNRVYEPVSFDVIKIGRTITNLFKNAVEAIGKNKGSISIKAVIEDEMLHFEVYNNGPHIPKKVLNTLFEPFVTHGKSGGTGLGLAICQKTIHDHKGKITVANIPEGGVVFDIYLPAHPVVSE